MAKPLIVLIVPSQDNPFFKAEADASAVRARALGYRVRVDAHDDDAYLQDNLIDAAIASNAAAIILDNAGADSSISAVRRATQAESLVFSSIGRSKPMALPRHRSSPTTIKAQGLLPKNLQALLGHKAGSYAELLGRESDTNAQVRTTAFHAVLDKLTNLHRVAAQSANWSQSEAFQKTETMLQAHADIRGIIAGNDTMALGAVAAVKASGLNGIVITGLDGSPDAIAAIRAGSLRATSLQPAVLISRLAVDEADQFLRTEEWQTGTAIVPSTWS